MNRLLVTVCVLSLAGLTACSQKSGGTGGDPKNSEVIATVDGAPITRGTYLEYVNTITTTPEDKLDDKNRKNLLENLVRAQLLSKLAETDGLTRDEHTRAALELHRLNVLSQAVSDRFVKEHKPTDEELRAEYDQQVAGMDKVEYHASHILVKSEDEAKKIIAQLKAGGNFAQIAQASSVDTNSAAKGGDLGWFSPSTMVPGFAQTIKSMKKGDTSTAPLQTEYGWHVLRVVDTRDAIPPPFDSVTVREQLEKSVEGKKFKAYVEGLMAKAKITRSL